MQTPIWDFLKEYAAREPARFHMPGHKGRGPLGFEQYDITEVTGADELFVGEGIIGASEANASKLFGAPTFYSTAGSTLCIQAMLCLALQWYRAKSAVRQICDTAGTALSSSDIESKARPYILAARNAHKALVNASALLDLDITWLRPAGDGPYYSHVTQAADVEQVLAACGKEDLPIAVYLTSPDYLGQVCDLRAIADVCHRYGVLLLVDNAHGAYLKFLPTSRHPVDLGVDLCCDSAHKTLPVLTGGAYLHIGTELTEEAQQFFTERAKDAMSLFGSSSPSYLIMASMDACNAYLENLPAELPEFLTLLEETRKQLRDIGVRLIEEEPLKLTIEAASVQMSGTALGAFLEERGIHPEFCDPDYVVLMLSTRNTQDDLIRLTETIEEAVQKIDTAAAQVVRQIAPGICLPRRICSPREAVLAAKETLPVSECLGRISAAAAISCPPAVPIVVCGEEIDEEVLNCFAYYGIEYCTVVRG